MCECEWVSEWKCSRVSQFIKIWKARLIAEKIYRNLTSYRKDQLVLKVNEKAIGPAVVQGIKQAFWLPIWQLLQAVSFNKAVRF